MNLRLPDFPQPLSEPAKAHLRAEIDSFLRSEVGEWVQRLYRDLARPFQADVRDLGRSTDADAVRKGAFANATLDVIELLLSPQMGLAEHLAPKETGDGA